MKRLITTVAFICALAPVTAQDPLSLLLAEELNRNMEGLANEELPPYFISYRVNEEQTYHISTSFGEIINTMKEPTHSRLLTVNLRVGSHERDNTHPVGSRYIYLFGMVDTEGAPLPVDNSPLAIRQVLWSETMKQLGDARDQFAMVQTEIATKTGTEDSSDDFSHEDPVVYHDPPLSKELFSLDVEAWETRLKEYSAVFLQHDSILRGRANIEYKFERKYFVSTEGSNISENRLVCRLFIIAETMADDGMELPLYLTYYGRSPDDLPPHETILSDVEQMADLLMQLRRVPVADAYAGPALLSPESASVFFHEIFGHRIEGHRLKRDSDAQTFKRKVNEVVLNEELSVYFDPATATFNGYVLNGAYKFDCEGQPGQRVDIVKDGVLHNFLMSRTPIDSFPNSNGHGRAEAGKQPVTRQSNMFIETNKPYTEEQLREMLVKEAQRQGKEYGYYFVETMGGYTFTGRHSPNVFNVTPVLVYKIFVDGREDELVRGVDLIGTPLAIFANIEAAGDSPGVYNGNCGAESGRVPVSTVSPMLFVSQIETQRKHRGQERLPILPRP